MTSPDTQVATSELLVATVGLVKKYPGTLALAGVDFTVVPGEVHALLGQNGAGKSTLIKVLSGAEAPTGGKVFVGGEEIVDFRPTAMRRRGVATIHQEFTLIPQLTVDENIALTREPLRWRWMLDRSIMTDRARSLIERLNLEISPSDIVADLPVGQQQMLEIAKAIDSNASVLILDEPTAALTAPESLILFGFIERLRASGTGIVYISHRLDEVEAIADRVTVLRNGAVSGMHRRGSFTKADLIESMLGASVAAASHAVRADRAPRTAAGAELLRAQGLTTDSMKPFDLTVRAGEIVALAGLLGSGRTEMIRALFGADKHRGGLLVRNGARVQKASPRDSWQSGVAYSPDDRKHTGIFPLLSVAENVFVSLPPTRGGLLRRGIINSRTRSLISTLAVKVNDPNDLVGQLSGGNQQKVVLARSLAANARVILADEPTRGVDIGAKADIWRELNALAGDGCGVLVVSSEVEELAGNVDRILVVHGGQIVGELDGRIISGAELLHIVESAGDEEPAVNGSTTLTKEDH